MSNFFAEYGLWLLIALLIVIVLFFLLSGSRKDIPPVKFTPPPANEIKPPMTKAHSEPAPAPVAEPAAEAPVAMPSSTPTPAPAARPAPKEKPATLFDGMEAATASAAPTPAPAPATGEADDLLLLKGVGPKLNALLKELGITRFAQIAAWTDADIAAIDAKLGTFKGRPVRDHWIDQAKYLAAGDVAGFEAKYGKL